MEHGVSIIWDMVYRCGELPYRYGHPGHHYGIWDMIWEMTVSMRSSSISIWDILSLWPYRGVGVLADAAHVGVGAHAARSVEYQYLLSSPHHSAALV